jgi:lipoprotein LpqH
LVGVGGAAIVVAGLTGCSSRNSQEGTGAAQDTSRATATSEAATTTAARGTAEVTVDGKSMDINGQVVCSAAVGTMNIAVGEQTTGIAVVMSPDASKVTSVGLGNVDGVVMGYQVGAPGGNASATKDGNTYTVTGTATGVDMANPMQPMTKPFEIKVTCP